MNIDLDHPTTRRALAIRASAMEIPHATPLDRILEALEELEDLPVGPTVGLAYLERSRLHVAWVRNCGDERAILLAVHERETGAILAPVLERLDFDRDVGTWPPLEDVAVQDRPVSVVRQLVVELHTLIDLASAAGVTPTRRLYCTVVGKARRGLTTSDRFLLRELRETAALTLAVAEHCGDELVTRALYLERSTLPDLRAACEQRADLNDLVEALTTELYG